MDIPITARELLKAIYRDYVNYYLTVERFAECNGLTVPQAQALIPLARAVEQSPHPES